MKKLNRSNTGLTEKAPITVMQFGEGNFLRAFVDFAFQSLTEATGDPIGVAVVQPIEKGMIEKIDEQDGLYHLFLNGIEKDREIRKKLLISNIVDTVNPYADFSKYLHLAHLPSLKFVISNTTEAGIAYVESDQLDDEPPFSFPAKLTRWLYERFNHFEGDSHYGVTIIPCELINYNAETLKKIILQYAENWHLGAAFIQWIHTANHFHNTLVDRIVPGFPKGQLDHYNNQIDYQDDLIVTAESFFLWVIEGNEELKAKLPFYLTNLDVKIVKDMQPYRTRKVRILNGAHTAMVPFSILYGNNTVKETMQDEFTGNYVKTAVCEEIIPTLDMDPGELNTFAEAIFDRFRNPFIKHHLSSIALNSISKFKVRVLPSLLEYERRHDKLPLHLTYALSCLIRFYKGTWNNEDLPVNDDEEKMTTLREVWPDNDYLSISQTVLGNVSYWDENLNEVNGLTNAVASGLEQIEKLGIKDGFSSFKALIESEKSGVV